MKAIPALDRTDLRLLALLQRDGRASNADLAAQVNLSPSACLRRIQRLEASGVVAGYAARLDPQALGLGLHALTGDMDYLLQVYVRDLQHFSRFLLDRLLDASGVADVNSSFVLRTVKASGGLPLPPG